MARDMRKGEFGMRKTILTAALLAAMATPAFAATDAYMGEVQGFAFKFCPKEWTEADGRLLHIREHMALFSLLGTEYGGDGVSTFALPDLRVEKPETPLPPRDKGHRFKILWCIMTGRGYFPPRP